MAQTRTIVAVDPATGARLTRRTARPYVAVVVTGDPEKGQAWPQNWAGRPDLAAKQLAKWGPGSTARLAPVVEDPWAEAEPAAPAEAEPIPAPVAGCRLAGDARHLFALFARSYSLTAPQVFALQSEALSWADRVALWCNGQPIAGPFGALTPGLIRRGVITLRGATRAWAPDALAELWAIAQAQAEAEGLRPVPALADAAPAVVAEPEAVARPHLPGEAPTPKPAPLSTAGPTLPDLKGAAGKVAALEYLAGGGALSSDVWVALGWPFEAFLAWAQRPEAGDREAALRARIRRDGVAASLAHL